MTCEKFYGEGDRCEASSGTNSQNSEVSSTYISHGVVR